MAINHRRKIIRNLLNSHLTKTITFTIAYTHYEYQGLAQKRPPSLLEREVLGVLGRVPLKGYRRAFKDTSFDVLIRRIVFYKLKHQK